MDDSDSWRWIWLAATVVLAASELVMPGTFFMISFAAGALVATIAAFAGASVIVQWVLFLVSSVAALALLVPLARRLNREPERSTAGVYRWDGKHGTVLDAIPAGVHETGLVRIEREEWRAESLDGRAIDVGAAIRVVRVDGTRLVVEPVGSALDPQA